MTPDSPRLAMALVRRELDWPLAIIALLATAGTVAVAHRISGDATPVVAMLRRFDLTVLAMLTLLLVARIAVRVEADHAVAWSGPLIAAGAPRWQYGVGIAVAAWLAGAAVFIPAAAGFALGVLVFDGNAELVRALPVTLAGGVLLLVAYSAMTAVFGLILRQAMLILVAALALALVPFILLFPYAVSGDPVPAWLFYLVRISPPVVAPTGTGSFLRAGLFAVGAAVLMVLLSRRYAGRRT